MAYQEVRLTSQADLEACERLEGILQPDRENLILVYGGSFNPPHQGHLHVLLSGLTSEVAAVAIVVLPSEDFHLRHKVANSHPEFFLHMQRRADIWNNIPSIPKSKIWVWTSTWYPFKPFTDTMVRMAEKDGFKLTFSHLIGPDNVNPKNPLSIYPYQLPTVLVTNKARHVASHFDSDGRPTIWEGFGNWFLCTEEERRGKCKSVDFLSELEQRLIGGRKIGEWCIGGPTLDLCRSGR